jgi:hypothetical protein
LDYALLTPELEQEFRQEIEREIETDSKNKASNRAKLHDRLVYIFQCTVLQFIIQIAYLIIYSYINFMIKHKDNDYANIE